MQIESILLYSPQGAIRRIDFRLGHVNIITGGSATGKSTLLSIVEYCLGDSAFRVSDGVVRDNVRWYAVIFRIGDTRVFVARPTPRDESLSQGDVFIRSGADIEVPTLSELVANYRNDDLKQYLSRLIGIAPNLSGTKTAETRSTFEATIRHTQYYLFQEQSVIANRGVLFHKQMDPWSHQAITDTFPYFLGAVREDRLKLTQELRAARRNLGRLRATLAEAEAIFADGFQRGEALLVEAQQVGLLDSNMSLESHGDRIEWLSRTLEWRPETVLIGRDDREADLQGELEKRLEEIRRVSFQLREARDFARETEGYSSEANEQVLRLESIGLFEVHSDSGEVCPICSSKLERPIRSVAAIQQSLQRLRDSLDGAVRDRPRLREYIQELENRRAEVRRQAEQLQENIAAIQNEHLAAQQIRDSNARIARVVGRISLYLETMASIDTQSSLRQQVASAEATVRLIEEQLDPAESEEILASILSSMSADMTEWAKALKLEFSGSVYRLDFKRLTVAVDRSGRPIYLNQGLGGGANWLGCHLIALLAIHKQFIELGRPVPRFLMLDQPTQIYFPQERAHLDGPDGPDMSRLTDEDQQAVERLFEFLFDVCELLAPNLQIIVVEHAQLMNSPRFRQALIESPWRGEKALIPSDWIAASQT